MVTWTWPNMANFFLAHLVHKFFSHAPCDRHNKPGTIFESSTFTRFHWLQLCTKIMSYTGASIRKIHRLAGSSLFRFRNGKQEMSSQNHCRSQSCSSTIKLPVPNNARQHLGIYFPIATYPEALLRYPKLTVSLRPHLDGAEVGEVVEKHRKTGRRQPLDNQASETQRSSAPVGQESG